MTTRRHSLASYARRTGLVRSSALGSLAGAGLLVLGAGCGSESTDIGGAEVVSVVAALTSAAPDDDCADQADDEKDDSQESRDNAARPVAWHSGKVNRGPLALKILGFNDFHGNLVEGRKVGGRPVGGAAVLATYLRTAQLNIESKTLIIHAGDHVGASPPESALLQDEPSIQFLNTLANSECEGPDDDDKQCNLIGTLGNHEFDEGKDELLRLLNGGNYPTGPFIQNPYPGARFPTVNANVVVNPKNPGRKDKNLIKPYKIRKIDGVKIGVIGAVLKETPTIVTATGVAGLTFLDEATAINARVQELKDKGVHTIIVTIHQGGFQSPAYTTPTDPAAIVGDPIKTIVSKLDDEVDLVISGHTHSFNNALVSTPSGHPILVTQAFSFGTAYDDIDLTIDRTTGDVTAKTAKIVTTYSDVAPGNVRDPLVQPIVDQAVAFTAPLVNRPVATFTADVLDDQNTAGESPLGNLIADAQRAAMGTDFAFMNPGGIRADLLYAKNPSNPADGDGIALWGELFTIQPFGNSLVKMNMTGQQVYDLLNQQFAVSRMLQTSGLTYTWDTLLPANNRVVEVRLNGVAISKAATYTVTCNNFLAGGGDGFAVFLGGTGNVGGPIDLDAFVNYVAALPQPFSPPAINRITRQN